MATLLLGSAKAVPIILILIMFSLQQFTVSSSEFEVGDTKGWIVPPLNDTKIYNQWASRNRFHIGDRIRFKYEKDSVMVVSGSEYNQCDSTHPFFFSNDGNTVYKFERSGLFYFISGALGHCKRGQKMITKVMSPEDESPSSSGGKSSHAIAISTSGLSALLLLQFVLSFIGFHLL